MLLQPSWFPPFVHFSKTAVNLIPKVPVLIPPQLLKSPAMLFGSNCFAANAMARLTTTVAQTYLAEVTQVQLLSMTWSTQSAGRITQHKNVKVSKTGLTIDATHLIFAASPDGLVQCACCGTGSLEIKCPYKHRRLKVSTNTAVKDTCLDENRKLETHCCYQQVQHRVEVTATPYCDFAFWLQPGHFLVIRMAGDTLIAWNLTAHSWLKMWWHTAKCATLWPIMIAIWFQQNWSGKHSSASGSQSHLQ